MLKASFVPCQTKQLGYSQIIYPFALTFFFLSHPHNDVVGNTEKSYSSRNKM